MEQDFNWFADDMNAEIEEFEKREVVKGLFASTFDFIWKKALFVFVFFVLLKMLTFFIYFSESLTTFINISLAIIGSFELITLICRCLAYVILNMSHNTQINTFLSVYRWCAISIWSIDNLIWFKSIYNEKKTCGFLVSFFTAAVFTSIVYNITHILLIIFDRYFIKKTLESKIKDVEKTENILSFMKHHRYEVSTTSTVNNSNCACNDVFCFDFAAINEFEDRELCSLSDIDIKKTYIDLPDPQLQSISDAKSLAKDIFYSITSDNETICYQDFTKIFSNTQYAINAYSYFDNGIDQNISKKTFHDTILIFYMNRVNLDKSINRSEKFVYIIGNGVYMLIFVFLMLIYLILFGIPLKELLAVSLSSALVLNFVASSLAKDMYYNFMMLLSHQFNIGDEIIVDGTEYTVYNFGLTSTSLLCENGGKVKYSNSELWKKTLINMSRAPEKILVFKFKINPDISNEQFNSLRRKIHDFLLIKKFDFYNTFSLQSVSEKQTDINSLECALILKCKTFKNKTRKFYLRVEMTHFLRNILHEDKILIN